MPSLAAGGMERVMVQLANEFSNRSKLKVYLLLLTKGDHFYSVSESVEIVEPHFDYRDYNRLRFTLKTLYFIRKFIKEIEPNAALSFGGKYNAFVLMATFRIKIPVFISDRSRPNISYGIILDRLNPIMYRTSAGIIAQTTQAKEILYKMTRHKNIKVINNPIRSIVSNHKMRREQIILNVGRFIDSKHQDWLIDYFDDLDLADWKLVFLGEGPNFERVKNYASEKKSAHRIIFLGNVKHVDDYYLKASIFAFTSTSEGFPNALGEAMRAGLACLSFDCLAGPSELIDSGVNGYLLSNEDHDLYRQKLSELCENQKLREQFGKKAVEKMRFFDIAEIGEEYYNFLTS